MKVVAYVPKKFAQKINEPRNVISITSPHESQTTFPCKHKRLLRLSFFDDTHYTPAPGARIATAELCNQIIDFIEECEGEDILVHCGEGRVRSPAIALFIERMFDYDINFEEPGCLRTTRDKSRKLYHLLREVYEARQEAKLA